MFEDNPDKLEELVESLYDLNHDLGKYIRLPLAMLPENASPSEVVSAIVEGIERTRKGPSGIRSAQDIFNAYHEEWGGVLSALETYRKLEEAFDRAVAWSRRVTDGNADFDRAGVLTDLTAVGAAVAAVLAEVERGSQE